MTHSMWYLENLDMCCETQMIIVKKEKEEARIDMVGEVEFDIDEGPTVKVPEGLSSEEETEIAFSSLPDIRSMCLFKESFVFVNPSGYFHVSFVQEKCSSVKRGYVQKSVFIRANQLIPDLPQAMSCFLGGASEYTAENALKKVVAVNTKNFAETLKQTKGAETPDRFRSMVKRHRKVVFENFIRGKSFLILGDSPTEVSDAVCTLSTIGGFPYGGDIIPYKSSFVNIQNTKHTIIGGTNEHLFNRNDFDNVILLAEDKYYSKFSRCSEEVERFFRIFEEYFTKDPLMFSIPRFMKYLDGYKPTLRVKRLFREFFVGNSFIAWLSSMGYGIEEI